MSSLPDFDEKEEPVNRSEEHKFRVKIIFEFMKAAQASGSNISIEEPEYQDPVNQFNPTLSKADISFKDKLGRMFGIWHMPLVYYPADEGAGYIIPDFLVLKDSALLYRVDGTFTKMLAAHEFLSSSQIKDLANRLLAKKNKVSIAMFVKKNYARKDLNDIKNAAFYLQPDNLMIVSEKYLKPEIKGSLPINAVIAENVDMNTVKFRQAVEKLLWSRNF
ncbi:MAG: hypothetical protein V1911_00845 [Candidatus Micrarchaeota archaeon]